MSQFEQYFDRARTLASLGKFEEAENAYAQAVALRPTDSIAQFSLAKHRYMRGDPKFARDLASAAASHRDNAGLQMLFANVLRQTGDLSGSEILLRHLLERYGRNGDLCSSLATVLHEAGRLQEAEVEAQAAAHCQPGDSQIEQNLVAILLSLGRADEAMPRIRTQREFAPLDCAWIAHEATAARLIGDPAHAELYDYDRLVRVYDLEAPPGWDSIGALNTALAASLTARHRLAHPPFDQSMRCGTQTLGNLVADADPAVQAAFEAFLEPIMDYRDALGTAEQHPLSARNHGATRYAGSWSVRLKARGFHVNHIHPEGWLSSAYYVTVPSETQDLERQSGWLKFGEPALPVPGAGPEMTVQPRPGRLVLFPSYMWHGTTAIHGTEPRLTMAFDVVAQS
jgi:Flp pilus assembly protein TadD